MIIFVYSSLEIMENNTTFSIVPTAHATVHRGDQLQQQQQPVHRGGQVQQQQQQQQRKREPVQ